MFNYVRHLDAVGTLYQEAAVKMVDALIAKDKAKAQLWDRVGTAIKDAWPALVDQSISKVD